MKIQRLLAEPVHRSRGAYEDEARFKNRMLFLTAIFLIAGAARAETITVTSLGGTGAGTLLAAITQVNGNADPANTIIVPAGTITLTQTLPAMTTRSITIQGAGIGQTIIDGNGARRIFNFNGIPPMAVSVSGMTLRNGKQSNGGAILLGGTPISTIERVEFIGNTATGTDGGAIYNNQGVLTVRDCIFSGNAVTASNRGGGAILTGGSITIENSTFTGNQTLTAGGALTIAESLTTNVIRNSTFTQNKATNPTAKGGAIHHPGRGQLTIENTLFDANEAGNGGAFAAETLNGTTTITLTANTFKQNKALDLNPGGGLGGAIYRTGKSIMTIDNNRFANNTAQRGGGAVSTLLGGRMTINYSAFIDNETSDGSGGAFNASGTVVDRSTVTINASTFKSNKANKPSGSPGGGALDLDQSLTTIVNSTFSGNSVNGPAVLRGSAIVIGSGTVTIESSTIVENSGAPAVWLGNGSLKNATVGINNTIISGNLSGDMQVESGWSGTPWATAVAYSLTSATLGASDPFASLLLSPLQHNGGPANGSPGHSGVMLTYMPETGSPAIEAGLWNGLLLSDQRGTGFDRKQGTEQDIGAVESALTPQAPGNDYIRIRTHAVATTIYDRGLDEKTIQGVVAPKDGDIGEEGAVFVFAYMPDSVPFAPNTVWYFDSARTWHLFTDCRITSPYFTGTLDILRDIPIIETAAALPPELKGTELYLGYGLGGHAAPSGSACNDMIAGGRYTKVYTLD